MSAEINGCWNRSCVINQRLDGKVAIVTGSNTGIGFYTASEMARRGATVIMACRNLDRAQKAKTEILDKYGSGNADCLKIDLACSDMQSIMSAIGEKQLIVEQLDLADLDSIRDFANRMKDKHLQLDYLINNAGLYLTQYEETKAGFEMIMGVNHLGTFFLTHLLIPMLKKTTIAEDTNNLNQSRIINVSSKAQISSSLLSPNLLMTKSNFSSISAYCRSKLANAMHAAELSRKLEGSGIVAVSLHPGVVATELARDLGFIKKLFVKLLTPIFVNAWQGAQTTMYTVLSNNIVPGAYYSNCKQSATNANVENREQCLWLWNTSMYLLGLTDN